MSDQPTSTHLQHRREEILASVQALLLDASAEIFQQFLEGLDEELLNYASEPEMHAMRFEILHDRKHITSNQSHIAHTFSRRLAECYSASLSAHSPLTDNAADISHREMTLVDNEVLEESLVLINSRKYLESDLNTSLWALGRRLSLLNDGKHIPLKSLPMAPESYCLAFQSSLAMLDLSKTGKLMIYKLFDRYVMVELNGLYDLANAKFEEFGVLPNLGFKVEKSTGGRYTGAAPRNWQPGVDSATRVEVIREEVQPQLLEKVHRLQARLIDEEAVRAINYSAVQLLEAAGRLQQLSRQQIEKLMSGDIAAIPVSDIKAESDALKVQLQHVLGGDQEPQLNRDDLATIDLVGMMFEYILNDEHLPDCIKAALSYLHTPYLKIAFADAAFFQQEDHPARLLLDAMADAGVRWVAHDGSSKYDVFEQIRQAVRSVVDNYDKDDKLLASLLVDFSSFVQKVELRVELMERRATEKARGEDRLREAKTRVKTEIRERAKERELPPAILLFLLQPWTDYMVFLWLRYGEQSESWRESLNLIDDLLWGLELGDEESDKLRWRQHYSWVEATISKGFDIIGYGRGKAWKLKRAIDKVYAARLKNKAPEGSVDATRLKLIKLAEREFRELEQPVVEDSKVQQLIEKLRLMEFGTWFEFKDGRREKVAWFNPNSLHFLFVDQSGKRTGIREGMEIAQDIITGEMKMIIGSAKPLVERTLESIYTDLNQKVGAQGA